MPAVEAQAEGVRPAGEVDEAGERRPVVDDDRRRQAGHQRLMRVLVLEGGAEAALLQHLDETRRDAAGKLKADRWRESS